MPPRAPTRPRVGVSAGEHVAPTGPASGGITAADLRLRRDLQRHLRRLRAEHRRLLRAIFDLHRMDEAATDLPPSAQATTRHPAIRRVLPS